MKFIQFLPALAYLFCIANVHAGEAEYHFDKAGKLEKSGQLKNAYEEFLKSADSAIEEKLPNYIFSARYKTTYTAYRLGRYVDAIQQAKMALKCVDKYSNNSWIKRKKTRISIIELLGIMERCSYCTFKMGQGWHYNRQAIQLLQQEAGLPVKPDKIDPANMVRLPTKYRVLGWRLIARESDYLYMVGRTDEARHLLREALAVSQGDRHSRDMYQSIYAIKLMRQLGIIESFIGYKREAISLFEREVAILEKAGAKRRQSYLSAKINLMRILSDLYGADENLIESAREVVAEAKREKHTSMVSFERELVSIESSYRNSKERLAKLEQLGRESKISGDLIESFYSSRNALFERAYSGEKTLDSEFNRFLETARKKGSKRLEPRIYRRYGDWLFDQRRYADALVIYRESLRMSKDFGWHPRVPLLYAKIGAVHLANGQLIQAKKAWKQMDDYLVAHLDIPDFLILHAWAVKLRALMHAGWEQEAYLLASKARYLGKKGKATSKWLAPFQEKILKSYFADRVSSGNDSKEAGKQASQVELHPMEMTTVALTGNEAQASFYLINRSPGDVSGQLILKGKGIALAAQSVPDAPVFKGDPGQPVFQVESMVTVPAGSLIEVPLHLVAQSSQREELSYEISWTPKTGTAESAIWKVSWGKEPTEVQVLNAARLGLSAFVGVPVLHHVGFPDGTGDTKGFRLRSEIPLRMEYRNPVTGNLIAVDANGNGDFTEQGDFFAPVQAQSLKAPVVSPVAGGRIGMVEVWLYPLDGHDWQEGMAVPVELHSKKHGWEEYARNIVQKAP